MSAQTLIERIAGRSYRIAWDEAVDHEPRGKTRLRAMYQLIPCRPGNIAQYDRRTLDWYCPSRTKGSLALEALNEWFQILVEAEDEWIFIFPAEKFPEVAKLARPYLKRQISNKTREHLLGVGKSTRFAGAGGEISAQGAEISTTPDLDPSPSSRVAQSASLGPGAHISTTPGPKALDHASEGKDAAH